jgi:hypothetical protein
MRPFVKENLSVAKFAPHTTMPLHAPSRFHTAAGCALASLGLHSRARVAVRATCVACQAEPEPSSQIGPRGRTEAMSRQRSLSTALSQASLYWRSRSMPCSSTFAETTTLFCRCGAKISYNSR